MRPGFANDFYWSSTEYIMPPYFISQVQMFGSGWQSITQKLEMNRVRPVRAF